MQRVPPGVLFTSSFPAQKRTAKFGVNCPAKPPELRVPELLVAPISVVGKEMPKRSCPFADSSPVQLKTRVRLKELSQGVMGERYRREIFGEATRRTGRGEGQRNRSVRLCPRENRSFLPLLRARFPSVAAGPFRPGCAFLLLGLRKGGCLEEESETPFSPPPFLSQ